MYKRFILIVLTVLIAVSAVDAQTAGVTLSLSETFFDSLLDAVYKNFDPPQFSLNGTDSAGNERYKCDQSVRILRERDGTRTAVRFRDGKISIPLAFSGSYEPPFIGCVDFGGWAEANLDLDFDRAKQRLLGRVVVRKVNLNGTGGIGGSLVARLLQGSIDRRLNPVEIISLDKLNFTLPILDRGSLRMQASSVKTEVVGGALNIVVGYEFLKP